LLASATLLTPFSPFLTGRRCPEGADEGSSACDGASQRRQRCRQHSGHALINIVIADAKNSVAEARQNELTLSVICQLFGTRMSRTINFDDELGATAQKVDESLAMRT
jgi:hypothetical protein